MNRTIAFVSLTAWSLSLGFTAGFASAADRTLEEFKQYAAERTGGQLSDQLLTRFAKAVDRDGDAKISDAEFERRMEAFRQLRASRPNAPAATAEPRAAVEYTPNAALARLEAASVLLITSAELAPAWEPFAAWKTQLGKPTKIVTVRQIAQRYNADSIQEQIRLCVRDHVDNHATEWVVLGGDCLPNSQGIVPGGHVTVHRQEPAGIPTDIVYLSETNWDADDDGVYGEFIDDREAISYPDGSVGLGRIPVRTAEDVAAFTKKVIEYESRYPADGFARQMVYTCTDAPAYPKVRNSWDAYVSKSWDGGVERFFSQQTPWDEADKPGSYELSPANLVSLLNEKRVGKLHIHGHGHLPAWVLENRATFTGEHVAQLRNTGAYPLMTTVSCNTGEYDSASDPSIVERMLRQPGGGSVAIVAPIRTGKAHFASPADFRLMVTEGKLDGTTLTMTRYWDLGLGEELTTGEALAKAKSQMAEDAAASPNYHLCVCELNLLGDPTLDMRAHTPQTPELKCPSSVGADEPTLTVQTGVAGSTVCVWNKETGLYAVSHADDAGAVSFPIAAASKGTLHVGVSGPSLNAVTAEVAVE